MAILTTTWKDVKGYEGLYQVNAEGEIKSLHFKRERLLSQPVGANGYKMICLQGGGKDRECRTVHSIVAEAFLGHDRSNRSLVVDHVNNNPLDNRLVNLQLISQRENCSKDKHKMNKSSQYVGVSFVPKINKWFSHIRIGGKVSLGHYSSEKKAKEVRDLALAIVNNPAIEDKMVAINNLKSEYKEPRKKTESKGSVKKRVGKRKTTYSAFYKGAYLGSFETRNQAQGSIDLRIEALA